MKRCQGLCKDDGRVTDGYAHILPDRQRVTLCLSCARHWRLVWRDYAPRPYGQATRDAIAAVAIVGVMV